MVSVPFVWRNTPHHREEDCSGSPQRAGLLGNGGSGVNHSEGIGRYR